MTSGDRRDQNHGLALFIARGNWRLFGAIGAETTPGHAFRYFNPTAGRSPWYSILPRSERMLSRLCSMSLLASHASPARSIVCTPLKLLIEGPSDIPLHLQSIRNRKADRDRVENPQIIHHDLFVCAGGANGYLTCGPSSMAIPSTC